AVNEWLKNLEDLAYDLDDLVDELNTEASLHKIRENHEANRPSTSMVQKLIPSCCINLSFHDFMSERGMASKLKEISGRLEDLFKQISILSLVENVRGRPYRTTERLDLTSVVEESEVYGREKDKENILNMLLGQESSVGKTTLAQLVYNDDRLKDEFDLKAWNCVSDQFDVSPGRYDDDDLNMLQVELKQKLSKKKFLLVLDDVWIEYYEDWDILKRPFVASKSGSKIIITTSYSLNVLTSTDALSLLPQHALEAKTFDARPDLRDIGKVMVKRCENLPLVVKALGGLLRTMDSPKEWEDVLNSEIWIAEELKRCFAYCALFPKDYELDKSTLVYLWIAKGFLKVSQREMSTQLGNKYCDELFARSFFQKSSASSSYYVMHDLLNDLAKFVAGDKCLRMDDELKEKVPSYIFENVRHLSFIRHDYEIYQRFNFVKEIGSLKTFLPLPIHNHGFFTQRVLVDILSKLHYLRVLSLNGYSIDELPNSVGDLESLRYLDLAGTLLKCLPKSMSNLINLQVLILRGYIASTEKLNEMTQGISQLTSLQTLSKMIVSKSSGMRLKDLGNLSLLQGEISILKLPNVVKIQEAIDARLMYNLSLTEVKLAWSDKFADSRNEILEFDVLNALKPHFNLSSLEIECYGGADFYGDTGYRELPFLALERLTFENMPNWEEWLGLTHEVEGIAQSLVNLRRLSVGICPKLLCLKDIDALPVLRNLQIQEYKITSLNVFSLSGGYPELFSFSNDDDDGNNHLLPPSIRTLILYDFPNLESLSKGFRNHISLRHLSVNNNPKLVALPMKDQFDRLWSLDINTCPLLKTWCLKNKGDYWPIIADIPDIQIDGRSVHDPDP
ncbi:disease resistance RPP13 1, partial [Olea europaea subsp. europaea]